MVDGVRDHTLSSTHTLPNLVLQLSSSSKQGSYGILVSHTGTAQHVHKKFPETNISATKSGMHLLLGWRWTLSWRASGRQSKCMVSDICGSLEMVIVPCIQPFWGSVIKKIECANQVCKCYRSSLETLGKDHAEYQGKGGLTQKMRKCLISAADQLSGLLLNDYQTCT